jgi:hypothetical protein
MPFLHDAFLALFGTSQSQQSRLMLNEGYERADLMLNSIENLLRFVRSLGQMLDFFVNYAPNRMEWPFARIWATKGEQLCWF